MSDSLTLRESSGLVKLPWESSLINESTPLTSLSLNKTVGLADCEINLDYKVCHPLYTD